MFVRVFVSFYQNMHQVVQNNNTSQNTEGQVLTQPYIIVRETSGWKYWNLLATSYAVHHINSRNTSLYHLLGVDPWSWVDGLTYITHIYMYVHETCILLLLLLFQDVWVRDYCIYLYCAAPSNSITVCYYFSTNNLDFVINFNCGIHLNSAAYANLMGVSDGKL